MQIVIDTAKKHVKSITGSIILTILGAIWVTFVRPQLVMASDLTTVVQSVQRLEIKVEENNKLVEALAKNQLEVRIDYFEDQIRILEAQRASRRLTPDEEYRLSRYRDDLDRIKPLRR